MKVLLINHFPLEGSGSGTYTKNIALHLRKRGHEVAVIFPENQPVPMLPGLQMYPVMFSRGKAQEDALPFNFPCFTTHPQSRMTFADLSIGQMTRYLTAFSAALRQALQEFCPDLIHAQHAWCLSWLASLCSLPLVVTIHGTDLMGCKKWPAFRSFAEEAVAGSAKVLAVSADNRNLALEQLPMAAVWTAAFIALQDRSCWRNVKRSTAAKPGAQKSRRATSCPANMSFTQSVRAGMTDGTVSANC